MQMSFNVIDILLVVLVLLSVLNGRRRGFIVGVIDLLGWVLSLLAGLRFYPSVAHWLGTRVDWWPHVWDRPVAFILVAVITSVAVHLLGRAILRRLPKDIHGRQFNQVLGIVPGLANGLIAAAIVAALLVWVPLN